jgi:hypothetical protein
MVGAEEAIGPLPQALLPRPVRIAGRSDRNAQRRIAFGVSGLSALGTSACARMSIRPKQTTASNVGVKDLPEASQICKVDHRGGWVR